MWKYGTEYTDPCKSMKRLGTTVWMMWITKTTGYGQGGWLICDIYGYLEVGTVLKYGSGMKRYQHEGGNMQDGKSTWNRFEWFRTYRKTDSQSDRSNGSGSIHFLHKSFFSPIIPTVPSDKLYSCRQMQSETIGDGSLSLRSVLELVAKLENRLRIRKMRQRYVFSNHICKYLRTALSCM